MRRGWITQRCDFYRVKKELEGFKVVWVHTASLGEFYQGKPILENIKELYPQIKVVQTFFSPSGYENVDDPLIDYKFYLPIDTKRNAEMFVRTFCPTLTIFVKYEFWPNYLLALQKYAIPCIFISATFRESHMLFKPYGKWILNILRHTHHIFVQDQKSLDILKSYHIENCSISGDTRFDKVLGNRMQGKKIAVIEAFKKESPLFIAGSSWKEDEEFLMEYLTNHRFLRSDRKVVIAPHDVSEKNIQRLRRSISGSVCYSEWDFEKGSDARVMILDTIGVLMYAYAYADIAYVGGGFSDRGLHNILEPASFGVPVLFGPKHKKFREAQAILDYGGGCELRSHKEFFDTMDRLTTDDKVKKDMSEKAERFVREHCGSSKIISDYIHTFKILESR